MTTGTLTARLKTWPGIILASLAVLALLATLSGTVLGVFRTPARVEAIEVEVRGHHDTLQVVYQRTETMDLIHEQFRVIQNELRDIRFILGCLADIAEVECTVGGGNP